MVFQLPSNAELLRPSCGSVLRAVGALFGKWTKDENGENVGQAFMEAGEVDSKETPVLQIKTSRQ